jgi:hypothetical protein
MVLLYVEPVVSLDITTSTFLEGTRTSYVDYELYIPLDLNGCFNDGTNPLKFQLPVTDLDSVQEFDKAQDWTPVGDGILKLAGISTSEFDAKLEYADFQVQGSSAYRSLNPYLYSEKGLRPVVSGDSPNDWYRTRCIIKSGVGTDRKLQSSDDFSTATDTPRSSFEDILNHLFLGTTTTPSGVQVKPPVSPDTRDAIQNWLVHEGIGSVNSRLANAIFDTRQSQDFMRKVLLLGKYQRDVGSFGTVQFEDSDVVSIPVDLKESSGNVVSVRMNFVQTEYTNIHRQGESTPSSGYWHQVGQDLTDLAFDYRGDVRSNQQGTIIAIGVQNMDLRPGYVRVWQWGVDTGEWTQMGQDIQREPPVQFGTWLDMDDSGTRIIVGYKRLGKVSVFQFQSDLNEWVLLGQELEWSDPGDDPSGTSSTRKTFGNIISISGTGNRIALSDPYSSMLDDTGIPIEQSGVIRLYELIGSIWQSIGTIEGPSPNNSENSLVFNRTGSRIAVQDRSNDFYSREGRVSVYELNAQETNWVRLGAAFIGGFHEILGFVLAMNGSGNRLVIARSRTFASSDQSIDTFDLIVYDYQPGQDQWVEVGLPLTISGLLRDAIIDDSGTRLLVSFDSYVVHVYKYQNGAWVRIGQEISGKAYLSGNGSRVFAANSESINSTDNTIPALVYEYISN